MGLKYYFDDRIGKWCASGLFFIKTYQTEEEMIEDKENALKDYFERRKTFIHFAGALADMRR